MAAKLERQVDHWLQTLNIQVSFFYLKEKLLIHPDYPSISSVTDLLDELGIENAALIVDKERLNEIPLPFLAHSGERGRDLILVTDLKKLFKNNPDFEKQWNGVVLIAEKPNRLVSKENEEQLAKEKNKKKRTVLIAALIIFLVSFSLWQQFSWLIAGLLFSSLAGLAVAVLIVQHELGISNEMTEKLCSAGKNTDCDAVIKSKGSSLLKWFNWADAGIIYFTTVSFLLLFSSLQATTASFTTILSLLAACSLPFILFSVYYQWRVAKKWCLLCVATVAILLTQFIILLPTIDNLFRNDFNYFSFSTVLPVAFVFSVVARAGYK